MKRKISVIILLLILIFVLNANISAIYSMDLEENNSIKYYSHIQDIGWEKSYCNSDGEKSGTEGKSLRLEAIKIKLDNMPDTIKVKYRTHIQNVGWQNWKKDGELSGTEGKSLRLEAIQIKLEGTKKYKVQYRVHIQDIGWQGWKEEGQTAGTEGRSLRLEAIEIRIVPIDSIYVEYNSHIAQIGWENDFSKSNGQLSGTTGKQLGIEALKIRLKGVENNAGIEYQAHVQNIGWQQWTSEEEIAGTTGRSLNIEAIKIKLNNMPDYSIQYRTHIQDIGWQEWRIDGDVSGTTGRGLRIEAIEIKIIPKAEKEHKKGIDVSTYQGAIDWKMVKNDGVDFAMIRAGYRGYGISSDGIDGKLVTDSNFNTNIVGALNNNIEVGVYFFTQAISEEEGIEEAQYVLNLIQDYNITYPIAIDVEAIDGVNARANNLSIDTRTNIVDSFCKTIKEAGYEPMIYANIDWLKNKLDINQLSDYAIWLANWTGATQDDPFEKPSDYDGKYIMWQYTDLGTVNGVIGKVDMDVTIPVKTRKAIMVKKTQENTEESNDKKQIKIFY